VFLGLADKHESDPEVLPGATSSRKQLKEESDTETSMDTVKGLVDTDIQVLADKR